MCSTIDQIFLGAFDFQTQLPNLISVRNVKAVDVPELTTLSLNQIDFIGGDVDVKNNEQLSAIELPSVNTIAGKVDISQNDALASIPDRCSSAYIDYSAWRSLIPHRGLAERVLASKEAAAPAGVITP